MPVRWIALDAAGWQAPEDACRALYTAIGAPDWCGVSLDALYDVLVADLAAVRPPFGVRIIGAARCPPALVAWLTRWRTVFDDAREQAGVGVRLDLG